MSAMAAYLAPVWEELGGSGSEGEAVRVLGRVYGVRCLVFRRPEQTGQDIIGAFWVPAEHDVLQRRQRPGQLLPNTVLSPDGRTVLGRIVNTHEALQDALGLQRHRVVGASMPWGTLLKRMTSPGHALHSAIWLAQQTRASSLTCRAVHRGQAPAGQPAGHRLHMAWRDQCRAGPGAAAAAGAECGTEGWQNHTSRRSKERGGRAAAAGACADGQCMTCRRSLVTPDAHTRHNPTPCAHHAVVPLA
jgi:hypothetical protein